MATFKTDHVGIVIRTGFRFKQRLVYTSGGAPVDLAGASARLYIKATPMDEAALFSFSTDALDAPMLTLNAEPGTIDFFAREQDTAAIVLTVPELECVCDFKLTLAGEEPFCLFSGPALLRKGITV